MLRAFCLLISKAGQRVDMGGVSGMRSLFAAFQHSISLYNTLSGSHDAAKLLENVYVLINSFSKPLSNSLHPDKKFG